MAASLEFDSKAAFSEPTDCGRKETVSLDSDELAEVIH
jgi:hypothetical protein